MTKENQFWYEQGKSRGLSIANYLSSDPDCPSDPEQALDYFWAAESGDRQFSPFEFTAKEINTSDQPEENWSYFEEGIGDGFLTTLEGDQPWNTK
jgi:hypothetical protein